MNQLSFLNDPCVDQVEPIDPKLSAIERPRLQGQNGVILDRLRQGPVTNDELSRIARKYTSRISDLRKAGYDIRVVEHDRSSGLSLYRLVGERRS